MARHPEEVVFLQALITNIFGLISTGTRIRTQIKGFGDPYATVAPCPCVPLNPPKGDFKRASFRTKYLNHKVQVLCKYTSKL
jgi:hypothetical protein